MGCSMTLRMLSRSKSRSRMAARFPSLTPAATVAVNDMGIYDQLTPEFFQPLLPMINSGSLLVIDANLSAAAIEFLAGNSTVPILAEPVSTRKAARLLPVLSRLHLVKPNRIEAEILSGVKIEGDQDLGRAADSLLARDGLLWRRP